MKSFFKKPWVMGMAIALFSISGAVHAQAFTEVSSITDSLLPLQTSSASWGDYDNDGDLDILITGQYGSTAYTRIYQNNGGTFTDVGANLPNIVGHTAWGDYDNDGDLDIAVAGSNASSRVNKIYRNDGGSFVHANAGLYSLSGRRVAWGDYDHDGDLDLAVSGSNVDDDDFLLVYRNDGGSFTDINAGITGRSYGYGASDINWFDCDNDGDLDLLDTEHMYRNDDGLFTEYTSYLNDPVNGGSNAIGDFDQDGDLDLIKGGHTGNGIGWFYRNNGSGLFGNITNVGLSGYYGNSVAAGDFDNDGDIDLVLCGEDGSGGYFSHVYRYDAGTFVDINAGLDGVAFGSVAWGDYDNDGDLDILITGDTGPSRISKVYRNNSSVSNAAPTPPSSISATANGNSGIDFSWPAGTDDHTTSLGLSYRLWIGTTPGNFSVSPPMADPNTGWRKVATIGNIQGTTWTLDDVVNGQTYYGCVSAIDAGLKGSACSAMTSVVAVAMQDGDPGLPCVIQAGPNPTAGTIHVAAVNHAFSKKVAYALTDLAGKTLDGFSGTFDQSLDLDLTALPSGIYLLNLDSPEFSRGESVRIVKQ